MVNCTGLEPPPPGARLNTVTRAVPSAAMSLAGIWAESWLLLVTVVGRSLPFQRRIDPATKFEPKTDNSKLCAPGRTHSVLRVPMVGTGCGSLVTLKFITLEMPAPGAGLVT